MLITVLLNEIKGSRCVGLNIHFKNFFTVKEYVKSLMSIDWVPFPQKILLYYCTYYESGYQVRDTELYYNCCFKQYGLNLAYFITRPSGNICFPAPCLLSIYNVIPYFVIYYKLDMVTSCDQLLTYRVL